MKSISHENYFCNMRRMNLNVLGSSGRRNKGEGGKEKRRRGGKEERRKGGKEERRKEV
jgi:hypothetical protein